MSRLAPPASPRGPTPGPPVPGERAGLRAGLGPLAMPAGFGLALLVVFGGSRLALALRYLDRISPVPDWPWLFLVGLRIDLVVVCYVSAVPCLLALLLPATARRRAGGAAALALAAAVAGALWLEVATFPFMAQYDLRPNRLFFEYLQHPREVLPTLLKGYPVELCVAGLAFVGALRLVARRLRALDAWAEDWGPGRRLAALPVVLALLFLGARSSLRHRPANISTAAFSGDHLVNELALDSTFSVAYAIYALRHEEVPEAFYGPLPEARALARVKAVIGAPEAAYVDPSIPLLRTQRTHFPRPRPLNLVVIAEESLGASYVGSLGGLPLTPELDRLSREGLWFTDMYATGTRTVRGLEALASSFLPTPGRSVVKLGLSQDGFFTFGELLRRRGYATEFLYGGESHFDNMRSFFLGNGFQRIGDELLFEDPVFHGTWGVSDEDLFREAHRTFLAHGDRPFAALLLTTTNHAPFEFPPGRIALYAEPPGRVENAMKYADWAVGKFLEEARRAPYFDRTVFVVVADHDTRVYGADLVPIEKFRIPALVLAPGLAPRVETRVTSQVDLLPTVLDLMGIEDAHPSMGRNLFEIPADDPGRAVMQFEHIHAYRRGDRVVVHQPATAPRQFDGRGGKLVETAPDPDLVEEALAHAVLPGILYRSRRHALAAGGRP